jgi:integrase
MPKVAKALSALEVKRLTEPGLHAVGHVAGLCLFVKPSRAKSWILRVMVVRRRHIGLGGYPTTSLAQAIEAARAARQTIRAGIDPVDQRRAQRNTIAATFERVAGDYIKVHRAGWKGLKHAAQWEATLKAYVFPFIGARHVADVTRGDVLAVLTPIWSVKTETASRLRSRVELILDYAVQRELRPEGPNPARWKGGLDGALPAPSKVAKVKHFTALPIDEVSGFMKRLRAVEGMGALALQLCVLTACRSGEARGALWSEFDLEAALWVVPAARMKAGREHRIPLSESALALLEAVPRFEGAGAELVFPGAQGRPLSDMTLTAVLRRMEVDATVHGFRSTFADWCTERTSTPSEVREMALAHAVGSKVEEAYRRGDVLDKRRGLMEAWATFCDTPPKPAIVRPIRPAKGAA